MECPTCGTECDVRMTCKCGESGCDGGTVYVPRPSEPCKGSHGVTCSCESCNRLRKKAPEYVGSPCEHEYIVRQGNASADMNYCVKCGAERWVKGSREEELEKELKKYKSIDSQRIEQIKALQKTVDTYQNWMDEKPSEALLSKGKKK